jgi:hypothetical protein
MIFATQEIVAAAREWGCDLQTALAKLLCGEYCAAAMDVIIAHLHHGNQTRH